MVPFGVHQLRLYGSDPNLEQQFAEARFSSEEVVHLVWWGV